MKIVVRAPNWVGDCVMALPFLQLLREKNPDARIVVLAKKPGGEVFEGSPFADEVWPYQGLLRTAARLRRERFDAGYLLPNSFSSALLFALGGVRHRTGYEAEARGLMLSAGLPWKGEREHRSLRYARLAEPGLAPGGITPSTHPTQLTADPKSEQEADALLKGLPSGKLVALNACANAPSRRWPPERWAALALMLAGQGAEVLLVGGPAPDDRARVKAVMKATGYAQAAGHSHVHDFGGKTTLRGLAAVLRRCKALVTCDTGIMHIGAAAGVPLVALEGAADCAVTAPWAPTPFHPVDKHVPCSPCVKNHCINRATPMICMTSIAPDEVLAAVRPFLNKA